MPLRYTIGGTNYFGICHAITSNLMTVHGAPLSSTITALWYATQELSQAAILFVAGRFADAADSNLLQDDQKTFFVWNLAKAYLAKFYVRAGTNDTGANQPRLNVTLAGNSVCTSNSNAGLALATGWANTVVDVSTTNYVVSYGDAIEVIVDNNGSNKDAENLTVECTFVFNR
jgi:hypothetical protein